MPRPLKRGILDARTVILSKDIYKYAGIFFLWIHQFCQFCQFPKIHEKQFSKISVDKIVLQAPSIPWLKKFAI